MSAAAGISRELSVPSILTESLQRRSGLVIFVGLQGSGTEDVMQSALRGSKGRQSASWNAMGDLSRTSVETILMISPETTSLNLDEILSASESGRLVVWMMNAPGPMSALRRILSKSFGEGRKHILWRLADQLVLAAGQMKLPALGNQEWVDAYEILLMTPQFKESLSGEDFDEMEKYLRSGEEESGVVSFNQSLLQLLLRRQIDIKTAFESTRDPVNLDQILKKVGI